MDIKVPTLIGVLFLASVHIWSRHLRFLDAEPRSPWLTVAGGASLAYVFVRIFPELAEKQPYLATAAYDAGVSGFIEHHIYLVALFGFLFFYGLECFIKSVATDSDQTKVKPTLVHFWIHIGSFAAYNALVGYTIVHRPHPGWEPLVLICIAMGLHFMTNDHSLRQIHLQSYRRIGRWVLAASIIIGWVLGIVSEVSEPVLAVWFALIAGSTIVNSIKGEFPDKSRFWPLFGGAAGYTLLVLMILSFGLDEVS